jgi:uncharacterized membrane protein
MPPLGWVHFISALAALLVGAVVLLRSPKGTRQHRQLGWTWAIIMLVLNASALMIYRLFGGFGPFHVAALISLTSLILGVWSARKARSSRLARDAVRRAHWTARHYYFMTWAYVGLVAAAVSETATRVPMFRPAPGQGMVFGLVVGVATMLVMVVGAVAIRAKFAPQLAAAGIRK